MSNNLLTILVIALGFSSSLNGFAESSNPQASENPLTREELASAFAIAIERGVVSRTIYNVENTEKNGTTAKSQHIVDRATIDAEKNIVISRTTYLQDNSPIQGVPVSYNDESGHLLTEKLSLSALESICTRSGFRMVEVNVPAGKFSACETILQDQDGTCSRMVSNVIGGEVKLACKFADGSSGSSELESILPILKATDPYAK